MIRRQRIGLMLGLMLVGGVGYSVLGQTEGSRRVDNTTVPPTIVYQSVATFPATDNLEVARLYATAAVAQEYIRAKGREVNFSDIGPLLSTIRAGLK